MANKLKDLHLVSVDLVRAGANQQADICLFKNQEGVPGGTPAPKTHKSVQTFDAVAAESESRRKLYQYSDILMQSLYSILGDENHTPEEKQQYLSDSLNQYKAAVDALFSEFVGGSVQLSDAERYDIIDEV